MNNYNYKGAAALLCAALCLGSCSDQFLQDKKSYGSFGAATIYEDYDGAKTRIDYLYNLLLPVSASGIDYDTPSTGVADIYSKSTEEFAGLSAFVDPETIVDYTNVQDLIFRETKNVSPYGRIRECNDIIEGVEGSKSLNEEQKHELLGQAYFFRAWCYYRLVKVYGGVPIIDHVQNPIVGNDGGNELVVPRSTTKQCIDFICADLQKAADYLPAAWPYAGEDFGRVTAGTALALKGRTLLLWASPLFNRADDKQRWADAYEANKAAIDKLDESGVFGLAYEGNPGVNATNWGKMFVNYTGSDGSKSEAVFVTLYNKIPWVEASDYHKYNNWEHTVRPKNAMGGGGLTPTSEIVDLFPMADGKRAGESAYTYDKQCFFLNRDPRFYRTFAFPGVRWRFTGNPSANSKPAGNNGQVFDYPYNGEDYALWNYAWYEDESNEQNPGKSGFTADGLAGSHTGVYVNKRSDDLDVNETPLYTFNIQAASNGAPSGFKQSAAPYMEIRYAEVLLNLAEAACGTGDAGHMNEAYEALKRIRSRVYPSELAAKDYGLDASIRSDRARLFSAILYERQLELAYEGKRFDDMRRWMLWDGGQGQEALKASWKLTGFGGTTCQYLGVAPLNGTRRHTIEVYTAKFTAEEKNGSDPLYTLRPSAINLTRAGLTAELTGNAAEPVKELTDKNVLSLVNFYRNNQLTRKDYNADGNSVENVIRFKPNCYFIGFKQNMMQNNTTLEQTVGWTDINRGGADGTFDPLAE